MNAGDIRWSLPKLVYHLEDLRVGMSYPNYYISRLAPNLLKSVYKGLEEMNYLEVILGVIIKYLIR